MYIKNEIDQASDVAAFLEAGFALDVGLAAFDAGFAAFDSGLALAALVAFALVALVAAVFAAVCRGGQ